MRFKKIVDFSEHYRLMDKLGAGAFSTVLAGEHLRSGMPCAVKLVKKSTLRSNKLHVALNKNEFEVLEMT